MDFVLDIGLPFSPYTLRLHRSSSIPLQNVTCIPSYPDAIPVPFFYTIHDLSSGRDIIYASCSIRTREIGSVDIRFARYAQRVRKRVNVR